MIKLKQLLLEVKSPDIFIPRRMEDRVERMIKQYIRNGSRNELDLSDYGLTKLPEILKNVDVERYFICSVNKLTTLENSPKTVGGSFYCGNNQLISLKGAPTYVGGEFGCGNNKLTSLDGAPTYVGGSFNCRYNPVKFTEEQVRAVCDVDGRIYV
jgi:hypothetical protein